MPLASTAAACGAEGLNEAAGWADSGAAHRSLWSAILKENARSNARRDVIEYSHWSVAAQDKVWQFDKSGQRFFTSVCQSSRENISWGSLDTRESLYRFALRGGVAEWWRRLHSYWRSAVLFAAQQLLAQDPAQVFTVIAKNRKKTNTSCLHLSSWAGTYLYSHEYVYFPSSSATLLIFPALYLLAL